MRSLSGCCNFQVSASQRDCRATRLARLTTFLFTFPSSVLVAECRNMQFAYPQSYCNTPQKRTEAAPGPLGLSSDTISLGLPACEETLARKQSSWIAIETGIRRFRKFSDFAVSSCKKLTNVSKRNPRKNQFRCTSFSCNMIMKIVANIKELLSGNDSVSCSPL